MPTVEQARAGYVCPRCGGETFSRFLTLPDGTVPLGEVCFDCGWAEPLVP